MSFDVTLHVEQRVASIRLVGELDSRAAPRVHDLINEAAEHELDRLVLLMSELTYLSSAGLRCLVFAHQKMGRDMDIVLVGTRPEVAGTIQLTGFDRSVTMQDPASAP
ncbi:MAG: STAS domain-containing protein [Pseudonocardiaceae bacterium]